MQAKLPETEAVRLQILRDYEILDTPLEAEFDDFTLLATQICGTPIALISLIDEERQWFKSRLGIDASETCRDAAFCAHALHHTEVFLVPDAQKDPRFHDNPLVTGEPYIRFYAGAPLLTAGGHALGTLCVIDQEPRILTVAQQNALQALARQVMARLELRRGVAARARAEQKLHEGEALKMAILHSALDSIITINADGRVTEWNPASETMFGYRAAEALGRDLSTLIIPEQYREAHRRGMTHYLATGEGPVLRQRIEITAVRADGSELPVELAITPMRLASGPHFTATLRDITHRKAAESHIHSLNAELTYAYDATIEGWARALDSRDHETEGHSRRVTEMTVRLARSLGVSDAEMVHVRRGALLHDIGKMGVPDSVLLKPGPLTEGEWTIMRRHPSLAYEMLAPIEFLHPALDIPYCHHEKWDGSGYPQGLTGEEIPLAARLFALVDVWDALSSDRPYRRAWEPERVLDHLHSLSGSHFEPRLVEAFLRLLEPVQGKREEESRPLARAA